MAAGQASGQRISRKVPFRRKERARGGPWPLQGAHVPALGETGVSGQSTSRTNRYVWERREEVGGFRFTYQAPVLRHFTAEFEPLYELNR